IILNERAPELRWQLLLRAGLGPHVRWECSHRARIATSSSRSGYTRIVCSRTDLAGSDRHPRPHRLLQNRILFGRIGWSGWDAAERAVVRFVVFATLRRQVSVTPLWIGRPVSPTGWLVGLRFRDSTRWQIVNHVIVVIVIDDGRTIPRIIVMWRISLRWRI